MSESVIKQSQPRTLFEKIWEAHVIAPYGVDRSLIYIDRHFLQETTCFEAFGRLRTEGLRVLSPGQTFGVIDHSVSTAAGRNADSYPPTAPWIKAMQANCEEFGVALLDIDDARQGIVHVVAPELGIALPGMSFVCGDSHTATCGGLGAWAFGIGTSQVGQVLASQALFLSKPKTLRINFTGVLAPAVYAKDMILAVIGRYGTAAATGYAVEYAGEAVRALSIEGRMTVSNMSVEFGARSGFVAADDTTFQYLADRPFAPKNAAFDAALQVWRTQSSDDGAVFDREIDLDCSTLEPQISWGTSPQDVIGVSTPVPDPDKAPDRDRRQMMLKSLDYMNVRPGRTLLGTPIDVAFIGSCTNGRLSDIEEAARIVRGRSVAPGVRAVVVPGSTTVKRQAEALGLHHVFRAAGFEWRESGCSMCVSGNGDFVPAGQRSISTTNRNFEGRQGRDARTHITSPAMVAAAAVTGEITDVRTLAMK